MTTLTLQRRLALLSTATCFGALLLAAAIPAAAQVPIADLPASGSPGVTWDAEEGTEEGLRTSRLSPQLQTQATGPVQLPSTPAPLLVHGGGWGHGVGMSQYGAQAQALAGRSAAQILTHYHLGTEVGTTTMPTGFRVGLRTGSGTTATTLHFPRVTVTAVDGPIRWEACTSRLGNCTFVAEQARGSTWVVGQAGGRMVLRDEPETRRYVDDDGLAFLRAQLGDDSGSRRVRLQEKAGRSYRWGALEVRQPLPGYSGVRATIDFGNSFERYLYGIAEVPFSWHQQTLRAQAIAARSYAVAPFRSLRADCDCWLTDGPENQVYYGADRELTSAGANWRAAVDATAGRVLTYGGSPIATFYSSSHNRRSENVRDVWGTDQPYHRSVDDPYSQSVINPYRTWTAELANRSFAERVPGVTIVTYVRILERTDGGTPTRLEIRGLDTSGQLVVQEMGGSPTIGWELYRAFGLRSAQIDEITPSPFRDTGSAQFRSHVYDIALLARTGLTTGCGDPTLYCPARSLARSEMAAFLWRMAGQPVPSARHTFPDIPRGSYYDDAVSWLVQEGITDGWGTTGRFEPRRAVDRGQMAAFLYRMAGEPTVSGRHDFSDVSRSAYYDTAVTWLQQQRITDGVGNTGRYEPTSNVTRAQMASFLIRYLRADAG
jgi:SpoIID/LytB domain protein